MIINYFKTTARYVRRNPANFFFRLGGLTVALFSLLVIALYISYHLSFDRHHKDFENIYRVNTERKEDGRQVKYAIAPIALGPMMHEQFPEIRSFARIEFSNGSHIKYGDKILKANVVAADSSVFDVFTFRFIKGQKTALQRPGAVVLNRSTADKIFGQDDPLHKIITINNGKALFEVTAVIEDMPSNSHFSADCFIYKSNDATFGINNIISPVDFVDQSSVLFIRFKSRQEIRVFAQKLETLLDQFVTKKERLNNGFQISLQPLKDIYLDAPLKYEFIKKGSAMYLYIFSVLGVFLLAIASINYINLSVVAFSSRSREFGIRKVMGALKRQIGFQVIFETTGYCIIALGLSVLLLFILFPKVLAILEPNLMFGMLTDRSVIVSVSLAILMLIILSTAFPAYWLTTRKSFSDLQSSNSLNHHSNLSKALLIVQFIISVVCITATLTVGRQLDYIHHKDLGIDRQNLIVMTMPEDFSVQQMQVMKRELKSLAGVAGVSNSSFRIGGAYWKDWYTVELKGEMKSLELFEVFSDDELFSTLGIKLIEGRTFHAHTPSDSGAAFVINETAARELGLDDPVGTRIFTHPEDSGRWDGTIVGVVADINISSLHEKIKPLVMRLPWQKDYPEYFIYVRIQGSTAETLSAIEEKHNTLLPGYPLEYYFVDEFYNNRYQKETQAFASLQVVTIVIVLLSSLGIFSLSIYLSARRMKEFGIRKVLGATIRQISFMHVGYFLRLAFISNLIALPLSWMLLRAWLNEFAYRTDLPGILFLSVAIITFLLVILSSGHSALMAARKNPVDAIRNS